MEKHLVVYKRMDDTGNFLVINHFCEDVLFVWLTVAYLHALVL